MSHIPTGIVLCFVLLFLVSNFIGHSHGQAPPAIGPSHLETRDNSTNETSSESNRRNSTPPQIAVFEQSFGQPALPAPPALGPAQIEGRTLGNLTPPPGTTTEPGPTETPPTPSPSQIEIIPGNLTGPPTLGHSQVETQDDSTNRTSSEPNRTIVMAPLPNATAPVSGPSVQQNQTGGASPSLGLSQIETAGELKGQQNQTGGASPSLGLSQIETAGELKGQQNQTGGASPSLGLSQIETAGETNVTGVTQDNLTTAWVDDIGELQSYINGSHPIKTDLTASVREMLSEWFTSELLELRSQGVEPANASEPGNTSLTALFNRSDILLLNCVIHNYC
jgi:hypothetical protein